MLFDRTLNPASLSARLASWVALLGMVAGGMVLIGWVYDIAALKSILTGSFPMKANAAACFMLIGIVPWLTVRASATSNPQRAHLFFRSARFCTLLVGLIGALTLCEYIFGWNPGIDQWLFRVPSEAAGMSHPGRMAEDEALSFVLLSVALWIAGSARKTRWSILASVSLGMLVATLALEATLSYLTPSLGAYGWFGFSIMALHAAIMFVILGVCVIALSWQPNILQWSLSRNTTVAFACGLLVLVVIGFNASRSQVWMTETNRQIAYNEKVLREIESILIEVISVQSHARGYLITGDKEFKIGFLKAKANSIDKLDALRKEVVGHPHQQQQFDRIEQEASLGLKWFQQAIEAREADMNNATRNKSIHQGEVLLGNIRSIYVQIESEHQQQLKQMKLEAENVSWLSYLILFTGTVASLLIFLSVMFMLNFSVNKRKQVETALRESEERLHATIETSMDAIVQMDAAGIITGWNSQMEEIFGWPRTEVVGRVLHEMIMPPQHREAHVQGLKRFLLTGVGPILSKRIEVTGLHRDGHIFPIELTVTPIKMGGKYEFSAFIRDITEKKESEEIIWKQANFDELTGLPNRHMFHDRLEQAVKKAQRTRIPMALMLIDLDNFKEVNDSLGHDMGDVLLVEAARRITSCVRLSDTVARLGGDEFVVILSELEDISNADRITQNIIQKISDPYSLKGEMSYVSASIGVTLYPNDAATIEDLFKNADQAMYAAKEQGRNRHSYFTLTMQETALIRLRLINDLRGALAANQFMVYFQPIVELATGRINKAEALIRWRHPERGLVNPVDFIPLAEKTGLIFEIGYWVFQESMRWTKRWRELHNPLLQISVNKSPVQFYKEGEGYSAWLAHLQEIDLPGQSLAIEITEGLLMESNTSITDLLLTLRDAGIQISMDDFGTGYSSLSYLKKFDIDYLKIDQSFVRDLETDPNDLALSEAIIVMGHKLGMKVIAEGVETKQQRDLLMAAGCDYAQGYWYSKPVPPEAFEELLKWGYLYGTP